MSSSPLDWVLAPRRAIVLLLLAAAAALAGAAVAEFVFDLRPCPFCYYQRWPYVGVILGAGFAAMVPPWRRGVLLVCAGLLAVGLGLALFHVGMEQGWWQGPASCAAPPGKAATLAELKKQIMATPPVRCDEPAWTLAGISFAGFNAIASVLLAGYAVLAFWRGGEEA